MVHSLCDCIGPISLIMYARTLDAGVHQEPRSQKEYAELPVSVTSYHAKACYLLTATWSCAILLAW